MPKKEFTQKRVAVSAALAHRPRLLLADEPTGELDAESAGRIYELIGELAREHGCTTVVVSHDVESTAIADRTVRVRDGRVSEEAPLFDEAILYGELSRPALRRARMRSPGRPADPPPVFDTLLFPPAADHAFR